MSPYHLSQNEFCLLSTTCCNYCHTSSGFIKFLSQFVALQIREAQALHMLKHRYTPSTLQQSVDESVEQRPAIDMDKDVTYLMDWHEQSWSNLKKSMDE